jgi:hypothetical protein
MLFVQLFVALFAVFVDTEPVIHPFCTWYIVRTSFTQRRQNKGDATTTKKGDCNDDKIQSFWKKNDVGPHKGGGSGHFFIPVGGV